MSDAISIDVQSYGEHAMAEEDLCRAVGEDLAKSFPGYDWMVGANVDGGTIIIDLMCDKPLAYQNHAYLMHLPTLLAPGGHHKVMLAGGELLERYGLRRDRADAEWRRHARENGLDTASMVLKSKA